MAEPQPPLSSTELATATEDTEVPDPTPASAEDRKAAAALSSLDAADDATGASKSQADTKALGEAMSRLELLDKGKGKSSSAPGTKSEKEKKEEEIKKKVKVDAADVAMLVEHLELNKVKATELLKNHEGSAEKALSAYITAYV